MEGFGANAPVPDDLDPLERKFITDKNAAHDDHEDDAQLEFDSDFSIDDEYAGLEEEELMAQMSGTVVQDEGDWSSVLTKERPKHNTGGKGVLADYEEARRITARRNETKALKAREAWKRAGYGQKEMPLKEGSASKQTQASKHSDDEDSDDEDAFFEKFRQLRLQQFSSTAGLPEFGTLKFVHKFEFVDEVDHADPRTCVVVHIYEDYLLACQRMNKILTNLAARYSHVKFLALQATEADQTLSHRVLPAFLVYKAGKIQGRAAVDTVKTELQNDNFTEDDVEWMLAAKYGVHLPGVDVSDKERKQRSQEETTEARDSRSKIVAEYQ